jgi:hypothetical protein
VTGGIFVPCRTHTVAAVTSGFSVSCAKFPITVPAGGSGALSFSIHTPNGHDGIPTIDIE